MKKKLFVFAFLISFATFAQTSIRVINLDVKMGRADEVARLFAEWSDAERKSGAAILQGVNYMKQMLHIELFWTLEIHQMGILRKERSDADWKMPILERFKKILHGGSGSMVMTNSSNWKVELPNFKNKAHKNLRL